MSGCSFAGGEWENGRMKTGEHRAMSGKKERRTRPIPSYVVRGRRLSPTRTRIFEENWRRFGLPDDRLLNITQAFGRCVPLTLEIGFGGGEHLLHMASVNPGHDFLGIEVWPPGVTAFMQRVAEAGLTNVRVVKADAAHYIAGRVPNACLDEVYILFPDPWPKRRHHKRRLIKAEFLRMLSGKVKSGGIVRMATDWANYGEEMAYLGEKSEAFEVLAARAQSRRPVVTRFEKKGVIAGRRVFEITLRRK